MSSEPSKNSYLDEVMQKQQALEVDLKVRKMKVPVAAVVQTHVPIPVFCAMLLVAQPEPDEPAKIMYLSPVEDEAMVVVEMELTGACHDKP